MMFHLGVLYFMAEENRFEKIGKVSTVSGGSLLVGLILQEASYKWPSSQEFLTKIYPSLRRKLCARSLQWGAVRQLGNPLNWRFLLSRSNLLALALKDEWGVNAKLKNIPSFPEFSFNGTTAENGKRFRFKRESIGDYLNGYADPGNFSLASALAVSAAFPGGFGPLVLRTDAFEWYRRRDWNAPVEDSTIYKIDYKYLHLYDGGIYDNLGLESFFDAGRGLPKYESDVIVVSDAGAPLQHGFSYFAFSPWRFKRVADIMSDQSRSLRVRSFVHYLLKGTDRGTYLYIGTSSKDASSDECKDSQFTASYPTTLLRPTLNNFDTIFRHGYRIAKEADNISTKKI